MDSDNKKIEEEASIIEEPKKKKCRWLRRLLKIAGAFVILLIIVVSFFLGPIVKFAVNTFGASLLGVDQCSVEAVKIYPLTGHVRFEKIFIGKPIVEESEFKHDLFSVELVDVDVDMFSLPAKKKVLDRFEILNLTANYEQLLSGETNVGAILSHIESEMPKTDAEPEAVPVEEPEEEAEEIFVGARYFVIDNVRVAAYLRGMPVVFPPLSSDFRDGIGMDEDLTPVAFGTKVAGNFMDIIDFFRKSGIADVADATVGLVSDAATLTGDAAKATADAAMNAVSDAATLTGDAAKAAGDVAVGAVSDAAALTGDAAKATVDAVADVADSVFGIFKSEKKSDGKGSDAEK